MDTLGDSHTVGGALRPKGSVYCTHPSTVWRGRQAPWGRHYRRERRQAGSQRPFLGLGRIGAGAITSLSQRRSALGLGDPSPKPLKGLSGAAGGALWPTQGPQESVKGFRSNLARFRPEQCCNRTCQSGLIEASARSSQNRTARSVTSP